LAFLISIFYYFFTAANDARKCLTRKTINWQLFPVKQKKQIITDSRYIWNICQIFLLENSKFESLASVRHSAGNLDSMSARLRVSSGFSKLSARSPAPVLAVLQATRTPTGRTPVGMGCLAARRGGNGLWP